LLIIGKRGLGDKGTRRPHSCVLRLGKAIRLTARYAIAQWENMDFDEQIQADPTYIDRV